MAFSMDLPVMDYVESFRSSLNPDPVIQEDADILITDFLSPTKLQEITGEQDLENVSFLDMEVNTSETTLGNFGVYLPNLKHLKFYNSVIPTIRDIGTSLGHITVLWLSCCGMNDVDGVASMMGLKELYLSYNDISDISPLSFLDNLEVLDLEGNRIADFNQLDYLTILSNLKTLTLACNPICQNSFEGSNYFEYIFKKLPFLKRLDEEKQVTDSSHSQSMSSSDLPPLMTDSHTADDIELISQAIKEGIINEETVRTLSPNAVADNIVSPNFEIDIGNNSRNIDVSKSTKRPMSAASVLRKRSQTSLQKRTGSAGSQHSDGGLHRNSRPHSSESGDVSLQDETSTLTFGEVICGNPIRALRTRKQAPLPVVSILNKSNLKQTINRPATAAAFRRTPLISKDFGGVVPVADDHDGKSKDDVLSDLISWRKMHEKRTNEISADIQVLKLDENSSELSFSDDDDSINFGSESEISDIEKNESHDDFKSNFSPRPPTKPTFLNNQTQPVIGKTYTNVASPPPRKLSPSTPSYRRFIPSKNMISPVSSNENVHLPNKFTPSPTPPKIGVARPRTASDFRTNNLKRSIPGLSPRQILPMSTPLTHPASVGKQAISSPHEVKQKHEIKQ